MLPGMGGPRQGPPGFQIWLQMNSSPQDQCGSSGRAGGLLGGLQASWAALPGAPSLDQACPAQRAAWSPSWGSSIPCPTATLPSSRIICTGHSPQPTSASPSGKGELAALENQDPPAPVLYTWAIIIGVYFGSFWSKLTAFPVSITVMGTASPSHPQLLPVREEGCNLPWRRGEWAVGKVS